MSIVHIKKRENPYAQIDKRCIEDSRLSWRARGILAYLLSKPENWTVNVKDIEQRGKEGRDAVQAALKELEKAGYASYGATRGENGKITGSAWTITEEPRNGFSVDRKDTDSLKNRLSEKPIVGKSVPNNNDNSSNNDLQVVEETTTLPKPSTLEAKKEKEIQPGGAAAGAGRVDIAAEIERLKQDAAVRENFTMTRRIPAEKFETYVQDFSREVSGTAETYCRIAEFRRHFFNWSEKHYLIEKAKATEIKPTTQAPRIRAGQD